jgi:pimeloyl-ACP methyl ester carboxylesterase
MAIAVLALIGPSATGRAETAPTVTNATVELAEGSVFYRDSGGAGPPVVFLHAGSGNSMMWENQIPAFSGAGFRFVAIDYRGAGVGAADSVALVEAVVTHLGLGKFHLLGTAAGGGVAFQYALAHPDRIRSVIVANSLGGVRDADFAELGNRLRPAPFNQMPLDFRELGPSYRAAHPEGVKRWLQLSRGGSPAAAPARANPGAAAPGAAGMPGGGDGVTWSRLENLRVPVLLLTGDADLYTPPSVLRLFAARMKQAEIVVIPESGHSAYWENPEGFNRAVLEFLRKR